MPHFISIPDAARELGVADGTIRSAVLKGRIPASIVNGRQMISRDDLEAYRTRTRPMGVKPKGRPRIVSPAVRDLATRASSLSNMSEDALSDDEQRLIEAYRELTPEDQQHIAGMAATLAGLRVNIKLYERSVQILARGYPSIAEALEAKE